MSNRLVLQAAMFWAAAQFGCGNDDKVSASAPGGGGAGAAGTGIGGGVGGGTSSSSGGAPNSSVGGVAAGAGGQTMQTSATPTELAVKDSPATNGVFDPAPRSDDAGGFWMSYSTVGVSTHDASLTEVRTRIASSSDAGASWSDLGVDPNNMADADLQVPNGAGGTWWATWHFEVSSLLFDPYDTDSARRYKLLWHRLLAAEVNGTTTMVVADGWIGLATAATPVGPWSSERKLFTGSVYDASAVDSFIGAPEFPLSTRFPSSSQLGGCVAFTEPSMLAKADGIYVSLQCAGVPQKIVGLRCDRSFADCSYLGDFLAGSEASQFSGSGQALNGFAATELFSAADADYLVVTPYEQQPTPDTYRGCLVFRISNLATATLDRVDGMPVVVKRVSGTPGSFNGACGYDPRATGSGIIYSEYTNSFPQFHLFASHVAVP